nr:ABC transporter substrate-binding protein [Veillonella ratti]
MARSSYGSKLNKKHTLAEEYEYINQIGKIVDREQRATQVVQYLEQQVNQARELGIEQGKKPKALIIELMGKDLRLYNENTLAGNIVEQVGGELLLPNESSTGYEELITLNPDVLFIVIIESDYKNADKVVARLYNNPALQSLKSVKNRSIKILPLYAVYSPGIRVKDGIQIIVDGLYPELAKEGPYEKLVTGN